MDGSKALSEVTNDEERKEGFIGRAQIETSDRVEEEIARV